MNRMSTNLMFSPEMHCDSSDWPASVPFRIRSRDDAFLDFDLKNPEFLRGSSAEGYGWLALPCRPTWVLREAAVRCPLELLASTIQRLISRYDVRFSYL